MTLIQYTKEKGISIRKLAIITGVCYPQLYNISRDTKHNITMLTAERIAAGTLREFGSPLLPWDYLDMPTIKTSLGEGSLHN